MVRSLKKKDPFTLFTKGFAVRVLVHVVGDMHQPLHNLTLFDENFPAPMGDVGGNDIKVLFDVDQSKLK